LRGWQNPRPGRPCGRPCLLEAHHFEKIARRSEAQVFGRKRSVNSGCNGLGCDSAARARPAVAYDRAGDRRVGWVTTRLLYWDRLKMALADEIEKLVRRKPGLTQMDLARMLHGRAGYKQQVNLTCRRLVAEGRIERQGRAAGAAHSPIIPEDQTPCPAAPKMSSAPRLN
jgi:hypothetical protein